MEEDSDDNYEHEPSMSGGLGLAKAPLKQKPKNISRKALPTPHLEPRTEESPSHGGRGRPALSFSFDFAFAFAVFFSFPYMADLIFFGLSGASARRRPPDLKGS